MMLEKLFDLYLENAQPECLAAYDRFTEHLRAKEANIDDNELSAFMCSLEHAAYCRGLADGIALTAEAAAARQLAS